MDALGDDRSYGIAHAYSKPQYSLGWAATSGGAHDHPKKRDCGIPERLGTSGARRSVPATRSRRLGRAR
jgi:hypothetical protein